MLLKRILTISGVRLARPGEFSERAFMNDKLIWHKAGAIADLIETTSEQAARSAMQSLQGEFSQRIHQLVGSLTNPGIYVEAAIDFPEEKSIFSDGKIANALYGVIDDLAQVNREARQAPCSGMV